LNKNISHLPTKTSRHRIWLLFEERYNLYCRLR